MPFTLAGSPFWMRTRQTLGAWSAASSIQPSTVRGFSRKVVRQTKGQPVTAGLFGISGARRDNHPLRIMEPKPPDIAVAIPALNERENLELLLPSLWSVTKRLGLIAELTVVDGR